MVGNALSCQKPYEKLEAVRIFVDEEKLIVDKVPILWDTRVTACEPQDVVPLIQRHNPASVTVLAAVGREIEVVPLI